MAINTKADLARSLRSSWINKHNKCVEFLAGNEDPHTKIHEIRKQFKQIRGLLRLLRYTDLDYKKYNKFYRDKGRDISYLRDSTSFVETLTGLYEQYQNGIDKVAYDTTMDYLLHHRSEMLSSWSGTFDDLHGELIGFQREIHEGISFRITAFSQLERGLAKTYKRARKRLQLCMNDHYDENYHELRKQIKYLRYQLQELKFLRHKFLVSYETELELLSDLLGMDHDLENFSDFLLAHEHKIEAGPDMLKTIFKAISNHRMEMQKHALIQGEMVLTLDEKSYAHLYKRAWKANRKAVKLKARPLSEMVY